MKLGGRLWTGGAACCCAVLACLAVAASGVSRDRAAEPPGKPMRIMSANMCNDILLLALVPKERIASITYLAHDAVAVLMPGADRGVAINHGLSEEAIRDKPDLILASPWTTPVLRRLAAQVGARIVEVDSANSFDDIRRVTLQVGDAVGERARAEALVAEMDRKLAELDRTKPAQPIEVVAWSSGNSVPGAGTLTDEIIRRAGAENLARKLPDSRYSSFGVEELLAARPDAIMRGEDRYNGPALRDAVSEHPVIRKAFAGRRITYPASFYTCGVPQSVDAVSELRSALARVPQGGVTW